MEDEEDEVDKIQEMKDQLEYLKKLVVLSTSTSPTAGQNPTASLETVVATSSDDDKAALSCMLNKVKTNTLPSYASPFAAASAGMDPSPPVSVDSSRALSTPERRPAPRPPGAAPSPAVPAPKTEVTEDISRSASFEVNKEATAESEQTDVTPGDTKVASRTTSSSSTTSGVCGPPKTGLPSIHNLDDDNAPKLPPKPAPSTPPSKALPKLPPRRKLSEERPSVIQNEDSAQPRHGDDNDDDGDAPVAPALDVDDDSDGDDYVSGRTDPDTDPPARTPDGESRASAALSSKSGPLHVESKNYRTFKPIHAIVVGGRLDIYKYVIIMTSFTRRSESDAHAKHSMWLDDAVCSKEYIQGEAFSFRYVV